MKNSILDTQTLHLLHQTAEYFSDQRQPAYLVGGSLRNILLGELCIDEDIVTGCASTPICALAGKQNGYDVHFHKEAGCLSSNVKDEKLRAETSGSCSKTREYHMFQEAGT